MNSEEFNSELIGDKPVGFFQIALEQFNLILLRNNSTEWQNEGFEFLNYTLLIQLSVATIGGGGRGEGQGQKQLECRTCKQVFLPIPGRYTKPKGQLPDYESPVVLKNGQSSIEDFCNNLHKSIMKEFKQ